MKVRTLHLRFEIVRDRHPHNHNGVYLWIDDDAELYDRWTHCDPEDPIDKPEPTVILQPEKVDQIVVGWLRGPEGPCGPMGAMGVSGT